MAQADAQTKLLLSDLTSTIVLANSATVAIGTVISQNVNPPLTRPVGTAIVLTVSVGALVPDVTLTPATSITLATATTRLATAGLTVGSVAQETSDTVPNGRIISQSPVAGTSVPPGSAVALVVSLGVANRAVPNVVGQTQAAATTLIVNAGLTLGAVTTAASTAVPPVPRGSVISQNPVASVSVATRVPPLSAVAIVVSSGPPQPAGLVLGLGFDEAAGLTAIDSSASVMNGIIRQALRVPGKFGRALQFDGSDDWVTVTDLTTTTASPIDLTTGMTLSAWVNPSVMSGWETILMKERGTAGAGLLAYALYAHDGAPLSGQLAVPAGYVRTNPVATTTDRAVRGTATLPLNTWTHIATTYDGANQRFYVNGVLVGTTPGTGSINVANGAIRIGGNNSSTGEFFSGMIDEVRVYSRALSLAEIAADMLVPIVR
jgi:beta-lactam-binding protein with PASTA domain